MVGVKIWTFNTNLEVIVTVSSRDKGGPLGDFTKRVSSVFRFLVLFLLFGYKNLGVKAGIVLFQ